jgi:hypothetical protein
MKRGGKTWPAILHIFVLCSFAIAQPLFDLLSRNAEFFVIRRSEPVDIILLVLILCAVLPASVVLVEELASGFDQRVRQWVHGGVVACLTAAIALQVLRRLQGVPASVLVIGAILAGIAVALSYARFLPVRLFLTVLSPAILIFVGLFLFSSPIFRIVFAESDLEGIAPQVKTPAPIVMVIFDEFSLTSLMDEHQQIDSTRYPHLAALARDATWFRNTTTVSNSTPQAVPAILTGKYPQPSRLPTAADHPYNLFTLLGKAYDFKVFGTLTQLCPARLCDRRTEGWTRRMGSLLSDLSVVYLHVLLPQGLSTRLPSITEKWMNFARKIDEARKTHESVSRHLWTQMGEELKKDRLQQFMEFVNAIDPPERPTLYFLHILLPHGPYTYLPSGKIYSTDTDLSGLIGQQYVNDEWAVLQLHQRYLLQVGCVDTLLGKLLTRLKTVGLYDRALLVIVADHGVSFRAGDFRRGLTQTTFQDVMPVPLFIKAPYQHEGKVSDLSLETIDILPTIADILGIPLLWPVEGRSALDPSLPRRSKKTIVRYPDERLVFDSVLEAASAALEKRIALLGSGAKQDGLVKIGPHRDLIGRHIRDIDVAGSADISLHLDQAGLFARVEPESQFVPAHITGRVRSQREEAAPLDLAIAINGTIRAVTRTWTFPVKGERGRWSAVVDESAFRAGYNNVEVFLVSRSDGRPVLTRASTPTYSLLDDKGRTTIISSQGAFIPVIPNALQGWVDSAINHGRVEFKGWAVDAKGAQLPEAIVVFVNGQFLYADQTHLHRPDIVQWLGNPAFEYSGFFYMFPLEPFQEMTNPEVRFFAVSKSGVASELHYLEGYQWRKRS